MKKQKINLLMIFCAALMMLSSFPLFSQYPFYFSQNKVMKENFKWQYVETSHFKIYYYITDKELVNRIALAAESGYKHISNYLNVKVKRKVPIIYYRTHMDFLLTNIIGFVPPGAAAFAQSTTYRVVVQGDASFESLSRTITHELAHIFEYEILGRRARFTPMPLWVPEGFSEFMAGTWGDFYRLTVRDSVLNRKIPQMVESGDLVSQSFFGRLPYDYGHMVYEFLDYRFGRRGIRKFLYSLRKGSLFSGRREILKPLDMTVKQFNHEFGKWMRKKFRRFEGRENPEDYSYIIGPDFPYAYSLSHRVSPSGEMLAVLTANRKRGKLDVVLISMEDGKVIKNITPGYPSKYDTIRLKFDPSNGNSITWDKEGNTVAFFASKEWKNYLILVDILTGKVKKRIEIKNIQDPVSPNFVPGKNAIYFVGQRDTNAYLYSMDLETRETKRLTDGRLFLKAANISVDGKWVVYSAQHGKYYKLFLAPTENFNGAVKITDGDYNDITPAFSKDAKRIFYSSNELESYNICSIDLDKKVLSRYTDVQTANFFPIPIPEEKNMVVMSSFFNTQFNLFKKDVAEPLAQRNIQFEGLDQLTFVKRDVEEEKALADVQVEFKGKYKPYKKMFIQALPSLGISVGTDGGVFGYSAISMTDLMGDRDIQFMFYSLYGYRSYALSFIKRQKPFYYYARLFSNKIAYYNYSERKYNLTVYSQDGGEAGLFFPLSRSYRLEGTAGLYHLNQNYNNTAYGLSSSYAQFFSGMAAPITVSLVGQNTRFQGYGPNNGHAFKFSYSKYIKFGSDWMDAYVLEGELRKYLRIDDTMLLAFRLYGYKSGGESPMLFWTGGNNTLRSVGYNRWIGTDAFVFNAEFRFPLVHVALTPIGLVGPVRGVFFFDLGGVWTPDRDFRVFKKGEFELQDAVASFGYGIEFFLFGYPMHVEWVWDIDFKRKTYTGVNFWIGFDF